MFSTLLSSWSHPHQTQLIAEAGYQWHQKKSIFLQICQSPTADIHQCKAYTVSMVLPRQIDLEVECQNLVNRFKSRLYYARILSADQNADKTRRIDYITLLLLCWTVTLRSKALLSQSFAENHKKVGKGQRSCLTTFLSIDVKSKYTFSLFTGLQWQV